jgi:putative toxin-antitoxin system antitoxin component (TIGR02293 family)
MTYICLTNDVIMKKKIIKPYVLEDDNIENSFTVREPEVSYYTPKQPIVAKIHIRELLLKDFLYQDFKLIANKASFNLAEWADMLHISERTLQRYAKENTAFNGLQVELILLAEKMIDAGNHFFGKNEFKQWLDAPAFSLQNEIPKKYLNSYAGIQAVIQLIGRLQHGIPA